MKVDISGKTKEEVLEKFKLLKGIENPIEVVGVRECIPYIPSKTVFNDPEIHQLPYSSITPLRKVK